MTSSDLAAQLLELAKTWTVAALVLGFRHTPIFKVVYHFVGEEPPGKVKSFNELSSEISTLISYDYIPIGWIVWHEYAPKLAQFMTRVFDIEDEWAVNILRDLVSGMRNSLEKRNIKVYDQQ